MRRGLDDPLNLSGFGLVQDVGWLHHAGHHDLIVGGDANALAPGVVVALIGRRVALMAAD
jgi:hypothetical protein